MWSLQLGKAGLWALWFAATDAKLSLVAQLPGVDESALGDSHFSGYIKATSGGRTFKAFAYFVQHPDPQAPLIVWMNGGPGASSLLGLFTELGPFLLNGRSVPRGTNGSDWHLFTNPYGWQTLGSLLVWEQPAGVGFSHFVEDPNCTQWDDASSARANLAVLLSFFEKHPDEKLRDLYIVGESYGGVYVPLLARAVLQHNYGGAHDLLLRGIGVGNGCVGFGVPGSCGTDSLESAVDYIEQGAPGVDRAKLVASRQACGDELKSGVQSSASLSPACRSALRSLWLDIGPYNALHLGSPCGHVEQGNWGDGEAFSCGAQGALNKYLALEAVQRALHVIPNSSSAVPKTWLTWDGAMPGYNISDPDILASYQELLRDGVRVLVYNGLRDTSVPVEGAKTWTAKIGGDVFRARRLWSSAGQFAGHVVSYWSGLVFATVEGAGHLVPADRPRAALTLLSSLTTNLALPELAPAPGGNCTGVWLGRGFVDFCEDTEAMVKEVEEAGPRSTGSMAEVLV